MKKKILFGTIASLFAITTVFNIGLLSFNKQSDATLVAISVMARANSEDDTKCAYRNETHTEVFGQTVKVCVSGGTGNVPCC